MLYSSGIDLFLKDLINIADCVFYFEEAPKLKPRLTAKSWQKMKDQFIVEAFS